MEDIPRHFGSADIDSFRSASLFSDFLVAPGGWFWGRIGGSDFDTVARQRVGAGPKSLLSSVGKMESRLRGDRNKVRQLNGFFDLNSESFEKTFQSYIETLHQSYKHSDGLLYGGKELIDHFNGGRSRSNFPSGYASKLTLDKNHITYEFIEAIHPFFATLETWMAGKKVLVVSPFSKSIEHQFANREKLFQELRFPDFDLVTYNTPITYNNEADIRNSALGSRTSNWIDELDLMKSEIRNIDFDVALLSCGSYASPLGVAISGMGKKAIYLGGVLNVFFNIYGQRYNTDFVRGIINPDTTIDALETKEIMARSGGKAWANEALRAYLR